MCALPGHACVCLKVGKNSSEGVGLSTFVRLYMPFWVNAHTEQTWQTRSRHVSAFDLGFYL